MVFRDTVLLRSSPKVILSCFHVPKIWGIRHKRKFIWDGSYILKWLHWYCLYAPPFNQVLFLKALLINHQRAALLSYYKHHWFSIVRWLILGMSCHCQSLITRKAHSWYVTSHVRGFTSLSKCADITYFFNVLFQYHLCIEIRQRMIKRKFLHNLQTEQVLRNVSIQGHWIF